MLDEIRLPNVRRNTQLARAAEIISKNPSINNPTKLGVELGTSYEMASDLLHYLRRADNNPQIAAAFRSTQNLIANTKRRIHLAKPDEINNLKSKLSDLESRLRILTDYVDANRTGL